MNSKDRIEDSAEPLAIPAPINEQGADIQELTRSYDTMFERRIETNPQALTMGFWEEHFANAPYASRPKSAAEYSTSDAARERLTFGLPA